MCVKLGPPRRLIRKVASLQQRIVAEVDARRHVLRAERHLLGLGKKIVDHAVEHETAHDPHGEDFFRYQLGRIKHVELKLVCELLIEELDAKLPLRECT